MTKPAADVLPFSAGPVSPVSDDTWPLVEDTGDLEQRTLDAATLLAELHGLACRVGARADVMIGENDRLRADNDALRAENDKLRAALAAALADKGGAS